MTSPQVLIGSRVDSLALHQKKNLLVSMYGLICLCIGWLLRPVGTATLTLTRTLTLTLTLTLPLTLPLCP